MASPTRQAKVLRIGIIQDGRKIIEGPTAELVQEGESLEDAFLRITRPGESEQIR